MEKALATMNESIYTKSQLESVSILTLPFPVMARVLYETYKLSHSELRLILPMLCTCKYIYYNYNFMLFTLYPLSLNFSSIKQSPLAIPKSHIPYLFLNETICRKVQMMYVTIIPTLLNRRLINDTLRKLSQFQSLSHLTVKAKSINCLIQYIKHFPITLTYLKVIVIKHVQFYLVLKNIEIPKFHLKVLKFQSLTHSKMNLSVVSLLFLSSFPSALKLNQSEVLVYQVVGQLLCHSRKSIEYLELEMLSLNQVFMMLNTSYHFSGSGYFPNLKLIIVDQTTNYSMFQISTWLNNCKTIIYINNYLSKFVIIKNNEDNQGIGEWKFDMVLFQYKFTNIKKQLNLYNKI